ncbi:MAG: ATP-binding protein, partial [Chloroflexota bacterium]|nr:ATP-binding protein [Chloroflexota bacterium]
MNDHDRPTAAAAEASRLGLVVEGSLAEGLSVRLDSGRSVEEMAVGRYVSIQGKRSRFFGIITDVQLRSANRDLPWSLPEAADDFAREVMAGTTTFGSLHVVPYLKVGPTADAQPEPAKTVPAHFAEVRDASQEDVERIFGQEDASHFVIGSPLDMEVKVCLNYQRFVERSNGVFGKSGTGKTFLTRLVLASLIQKSNAQREPEKRAVNLVFDMHNEYGWKGTREGGSGEVKALKQLFSASVAVFTLDVESSRRRGVSTDAVVEIGYDEVEPEDIEVLRETLNLTDLAVSACFTLERRFGHGKWLAETLKREPGDEELVSLNIAESTLKNLWRGLQKLARLDFMRPHTEQNSVQAILNYLQGGKNVVLEFGRHGDNITAYVLVANLLTRRIHERYRQQKEAALGDRAQEPIHLVITIEEAHKFLSPQVAGQTVFGQIAREMRKYNVTLLVIDQRPSGIDSEVMSQIGTKITCLLDNDADVDAVLAGVSEKRELKSVLARLESRQQALIFGHAVPMPVVVRTEEYGSEASYTR